MKDKETRQRIIRRLVERKRIASQEELSSLLRAEGIETTQATLSRDLKDLRIAKIHDDAGGYVYALPRISQPARINSSQSEHTLSGIDSVEFSGNFCVLLTRPGFASMVASFIDMNLGHEIMGSIAGDDTILVILRQHAQPDVFLTGLENLIPGISDKVRK